MPIVLLPQGALIGAPAPKWVRLLVTARRHGSAERTAIGASYDAAHYLMTPSHALELALAAERRAEGFFAAVAAQTANPETKRLAQEFAAEEKLHAARIGEVVERMPAPPSDWRADYDPPLGLG